MATLYHYTNATGLLGILDQKSFWASEYRFLNDSSEFNLGWKLLSETLTARNEEISAIDPGAGLITKDLSEYTQRTGIFGFVASLTTQGDLLSQWRGYNGGRGYSIGINDEWLSNNAASQGFKLFPVVYEDQEHRGVANDVVDLLIGMLEDLNGDHNRAVETVGRWWKHALIVPFACKDRHFQEEQEYRLTYISESWPNDMKMRTSAQGLVPYLPCFFNRQQINSSVLEPRNHGLERIIIGPALREAQKAAVDAAQAKHGMRFEIRQSEIPYVAD